jgi:hypothetical protein
MVFFRSGEIKTFNVFSFFVFLAVLCFTAASSGETIRWSSPAESGDTRFSNPANWSNGKVPHIGDTAVFDSSAEGSSACILDTDASISAIVFQNNYKSLFDFNSHFLTITGNVADFRSSGEVDGTKNRGGVVFSGSSLQHFYPGKAHFPCIIVQGRTSQFVICHEMGMLADTLILTTGTLVCGTGLVHLCVEIRGTGGSLDFGSSSISVSGAGVFLSRAVSVSARTGTLICTGSGVQHIELPSDTTTLHAFIQNSVAGCRIGNKRGIYIDSLAIRSGSLLLADSQCLTVGNLAVVHGGLAIPKSGSLIIRKSADLSGLDTIEILGVLGFCGEAVTFTPKTGLHTHIAAISVLKGMVTMTGRGCNADELHLSTTSQPCTLSLGRGLTHTFRIVTANAGAVIDFGSSILRFIGDTLDLSRCGVSAGRSDYGALFFCGTNPQVLVPAKIAAYPSFVQNGMGGTTVCKNGFSCGRLNIQSGTFHLGSGLSHTVTILLRACGGGLDFGSSTLNTSADTVDLTGANELSSGTGTLSFIGTTGTQIFKPRPGALHPDLAKSQNGTVRTVGALRAKKFRISAGAFDPGDDKCELSGFSAKGGTFITGRDSLIITGNANFSDLSEFVPGKAPLVVRADGNNPNVSFSSTAHAIGHLVLSAMPSQKGTAKITAGKGIHWVSRLTFQWNRSADSAIFDFRQAGSGVVAADSVDVQPINSGSDNGVIFMGNGAWTFGGDVTLRNYACDSSTVIFNRQNGRQTVDSPLRFNNIIHSGGGTLVFAAALSCRNFTQSNGILDFRSTSCLASSDFSLLNGTGQSIATSPFPWKIKAGRNVFLSGSPDTLLTIGNTPACTILAGASLTARYSILKHCAAALQKGIAYNSKDSTCNSNWTFINRPPPITISAAYISFGNLRLGTTRDTIITLANACNDTVTIFSTQRTNAAFSDAIDNIRIPPHQIMNDTILYSPDDAGPDTGCIIFASNAESSPDTIRLFGTGRGARLHCSVDTVSFGTIAMSKTLHRTIVLKNTGTDTLRISQSIQQADHENDFDSVFFASPLRFCAPQDSCMDTIRFFPKKPGPFSAFLILKSNCQVQYDTILITAHGTADVPVEDPKPAIPNEFTFQEIGTMEKSVVFKYGLPATARVSLEMYDAIGRIIERPIESVLGPSEYQFTWDASRLSRGIYFCRFMATDGNGPENRFVKTIRVVFSK